ncbi:MAG: hypothetical protein Q8L13_21185, partial [Bradyrhizobium sp.]|uniref:hypothetical protein n=1 Tax=Bradyrhizobium sp. TaxID=376 RepID=UPI00272EF61E
AGHDTPATEGSPVSIPGWTITVSIIVRSQLAKIQFSAASMSSGNVCSGKEFASGAIPAARRILHVVHRILCAQ